MSETFCPIPWNFQAVRNNGDVRVCCQANVSENRGIIRDEQGVAYNAKEGRLDEARNAPLMKAVRSNMLKGRWSPECIRCKQEEEAGLSSRRHYEQENWDLTFEDVQSFTDADGTLDLEASPVQYYDLRFGNKCNLSCRMCGPSDSDQWYGDYVALHGQTFYKDSHGRVDLEKKGNRWVDTSRSYSWYESEEFWKEMRLYQPGLKHIYMAGGEPLLIKQHYKFLEDCIANGFNSQMILEYNTNMTILPDVVISLWKQFKEVRVGASIDGYGDVFEFQRYPGKWPDVYKNLKKLDSLGRPIKSWFAYTVTVYNVMHLPEFMRWKVEDSGIKNISSSRKRPILAYHMAHKPDHLNIRNLSKEQKQRVLSRFSEFRNYYRKQFSEALGDNACAVLDSVEKYMLAKDYDSEVSATLNSFNEKMDEIRLQDSRLFLP